VAGTAQEVRAGDTPIVNNTAWLEDSAKINSTLQSHRMYKAVRFKGLPVAYLEIRGEGHGFRQAASFPCNA
jgi:hypothetical protein